MIAFSKIERWDQSRFSIYYDPQEVKRHGRDGGEEVTYEYAHHILVPEVSKGAVVEALLRTRYTINDELALLRQKASKKAEFAEYDSFAEDCKALADQILA